MTTTSRIDLLLATLNAADVGSLDSIGEKLTLSIEEKTVRRARRVAESMGLTLNQAVRGFLEELAGGRPAEEDIREVEHLSEGSSGRSRGWRFDRDEIHERP